MYYFKDLTGQTFGRLEVVDRCYSKKNNKNRRIHWNCVCSCGKLCIINAGSLLNKGTQSCGCLRTELLTEMHKKRPYESLYNKLCNIADKTGRDRSITYEEFLEFTKESKCHYCRSMLVWQEYNIHKLRGKFKGIASVGYNIDRKDNDIGYHKENCIVCCGRCNKAKSNHFSYKEWYRMTQPFRDGEL